MIGNIIKILQKGDYYGAGDFTELAKGKLEMVTTFKEFKRKAKRLWLSRKK